MDDHASRISEIAQQVASLNALLKRLSDEAAETLREPPIIAFEQSERNTRAMKNEIYFP